MLTSGGTGLCLPFELTIQGFPRMKSDWEAPNPKDIMTAAMGNLTKLQDELWVAIFELGVGTWEGGNSDLVEVLSMPILMMAQAVNSMAEAVNSMAEAKEIGNDAQDREKEDLILTILSIVLFIVPSLGEVTVAAAGLARLARLFAATGAVSAVGMTIVDVIENPDMAPLAIASLLFAGRIRSPTQYRDAVKVRQQMTQSVSDGLGNVFGTNNKALTNIIKVCRAR